LRSREFRLTREPQEEGRDPVRELAYRFRESRLTREPKEEGKDPDSELA